MTKTGSWTSPFKMLKRLSVKIIFSVINCTTITVEILDESLNITSPFNKCGRLIIISL
jgi:hypothetical protein